MQCQKMPMGMVTLVSLLRVVCARRHVVPAMMYMFVQRATLCRRPSLAADASGPSLARAESVWHCWPAGL